MTPIGLVIMVSLSLAILFAPREWAAAAVMASVMYLTDGQKIMLGGISFFAIRFIEIAGFTRIVLKGELRKGRLNGIDKIFLAFQGVYLLIFLIGFSIHHGKIVTPAYVIGSFCDGVSSYFIFRSLLTDPAVLKDFLKKCAYLMVPFAVFMVIESVTGHNLFSSMGGVPTTPVVRSGHFRAQGSFGVAITAGSLGATLMPLFVAALSWNAGFWGVTGIASCLVIVITAHSGGPLLALAAGMGAWYCWRIRESMRKIRWGILFSVVALQLLMKAPIWFLLDRFGSLTGGHGWDRANLIDQFVKHFGSWWLAGMPLEKTGNWAATRLPTGSTDVTNAYVSFGLNGGLITMILLILLFIECFKYLGDSMKILRLAGPEYKRDELMLWGAGCCLFSHMINLIGVRYFDQMYVVWYMSFAVISSLSAYYINEFKANAQDGSHGAANELDFLPGTI